MSSTASGLPSPHDPRPPVCVLGLGLIGGSLLRAVGAAGRTAWGHARSAATADAAVADGYDAGTDLADALRRADRERAIVVVAVPAPAVDEAFAAIAEHAPNATVTDVVSVKTAVLAAAREHGLTGRYVGGHPMAGTSESGWGAGFPELFRDAVWVVGTEDDSDPDVWTQVAALAFDCGSVVVPAAAVEHDNAVARISHLPHLLAEALAVTADAGGPLALGLAAGSFRDGTRVAATAPGLVNAMCEGNRDALLVALDDALTLLRDARNTLAQESSTAPLVSAGHTARTRYDERTHTVVEGIVPGSDGWTERMRDAGRRGGRLHRPDEDSFM
ncbi:prephenate dehydrogenase [Rhodococcus rhodnii]|uniref:prephenate dehydrogenase n=1 Tax=Rhodococcus rhodnii TaxID=38312 RepID=UPI001EE74D15|nr:prephenate dehydrogenase [Rhodococcus rhodnii]